MVKASLIPIGISSYIAKHIKSSNASTENEGVEDDQAEGLVASDSEDEDYNSDQNSDRVIIII